MGQFDTADNLTPRTIWQQHKFYISSIVWPQNMIRNILIATIYLFDWKLSCIMSLYQIRARQGPHIKTYLISWQLFGPKISLEIHCWPITTFFKTVGENFSWCQIVLFCMMVSNCPFCTMVSNCPRCQIVLGVKLSSLPSWCQIVLLAIMVSNCPKCQMVLGVKLSAVSNGPRILVDTWTEKSLLLFMINHGIWLISK